MYGPVPVPLLARSATLFGVAHLDVDERVREDRARAAELDPDQVRVDHAHRPDVLRVRALLRRHRRIEHAQDVRPHVVGRERPAGRVLHALAEGEEPGLQILRRAPLRRQVGHDVHVAVVLGEAVVEQRLQRHLAGEGERVRVELGDARAGDAVLQRALGRRAAGRRGDGVGRRRRLGGRDDGAAAGHGHDGESRRDGKKLSLS